MPLFKKKDKHASTEVQPQSQTQQQQPPSHHQQPYAPPQDNRQSYPPHNNHYDPSRPNLHEEGSNSTFNTAPSNGDRSSNLSSANTRVNEQTDNHGNRQTVVTTTTTTTVTTVTSDGRVFTEQHDRQPGELPPNPSSRPRSPDHQAPQMPVQNAPYQAPSLQNTTTQAPPLQNTTTPAPTIPNRHARRTSQPESLAQHQQQPATTPPNGALNSHPPPPMPTYPVQQGYDSAPAPTASPNFSRPGHTGRRENVKHAIAGIHGMGEGLRGAINTKTGEWMGDDPETVARNREIRDKGMRDAKAGGMFSRVPVGHHGGAGGGGGGADDRTRLRRQSVGNEAARNF